MLDLHRENAWTSTQEYSRRHEKVTLQSQPPWQPARAGRPTCQGRPPEGSSQSAATSRILPPAALSSNLERTFKSVWSKGCGAS